MNVWAVWKSPDMDREPVQELDWEDECLFGLCGTYPTGELMGVFGSPADAEEHANLLQGYSPSNRFDEQPYFFHVEEFEVR